MNAKKTRRKETLLTMSQAELVARHSKAIMDIELIWEISEEQFCEKAGDDRTCADAITSAKCGSMKHRALAFHRDADALAATVAVPVTRAGER